MTTQEPPFKPPSLNVSIWVLVILIAGVGSLIACIFWFTANFAWYCVMHQVDAKSLTFVVALAIAAVLQLFRFLHNLIDALIRHETAFRSSADILRRLKELATMPLLQRDEGGATKMSDFLMEIIREVINRLKK